MPLNGTEFPTKAGQAEAPRRLTPTLASPPNPRWYQGLSLPELAERIASHSDCEALRELHDHRPLFQLHGGAPVLMVGFVELLCTSARASQFARGNTAILDQAYDATIDKFSHIPEVATPGADDKRGGHDCRTYFRAFMELWAKRGRADELDELSQEAKSASILQGQVVRAFHYSCLEARRRANPRRTRYAWQTDVGVISVLMPRSLAGPARRLWLEQNIGEPGSASEMERRRIQAVIDERLGLAAIVPLDELSLEGDLGAKLALESLVQEEIGACGLIEFIADEKADNIAVQRPAIRDLGPVTLPKLVRCILTDLIEGAYEEKRTAETFGISLSTLSRFAGQRWEGDATPPDLWVNIAHTMAGHETFVEVAKEAGVWARVQQLAPLADASRQRRSKSHE